MNTPDINIKLVTIDGQEKTISQISTLFEPALIFLPTGRDAAGFMPVVEHIYKTFGGSSLRCSIVLTLPEEQAKEVLSGYEDVLKKINIFIDSKRTLLESLNILHVPAYAHLGIGGNLVSSVEGWSISSWQEALDLSAKHLKWTSPQLLTCKNAPKSFTQVG